MGDRSPPPWRSMGEKPALSCRWQWPWGLLQNLVPHGPRRNPGLGQELGRSHPRPPGRPAGGHGSGFVTEQGLRMARLGPLRPPMGALVSLQPGRRDHGTPDTADAFAAPLGGEIGAGGAVAEQTDHQSLRESEEPRGAGTAARLVSVKLHSTSLGGRPGARRPLPFPVPDQARSAQLLLRRGRPWGR